MNQIKSAIKTQKPKRKQQLKGVWNPITICKELVQDQLNKSASVGSSTKYTKTNLNAKNSKTIMEIR